MEEHPNATRVRQLLTAFDDPEPDWQLLNDNLADDVVWHMIGKAEPIRGKENLGAIRESFGDAQFADQEVHDVVANDDHTIALVETTVRRGDDTLTYRTAEIMHIRDGKVAERWSFSDDTEAINRFFA